MELDRANIRLHASVASKREAIQAAGGLLVDNGYIKSGYVGSMLEREKVANTFLGNGIAIPHGLPKDRDLIVNTGISVVQIPDGVTWNHGETVYLVVGIAARSDEHLQVLVNLTHLLDDQAALEALRTADDPARIIEHLSRLSTDTDQTARSAEDVLPDFAAAVEVQIAGKSGLHARPATFFVDIAKQFAADIHVRHRNTTANGKSLVSLLKLGAEGGATIRIMAQGPDEEAALQALKEAVLSGLGDEEEEQVEQAVPAHGWAPAGHCTVIPGLGASPGLAIGPVRTFIQQRIVVESTAKDPAEEEKRLQQAVAAAKYNIEELYQSVKNQCGANKAAIFRAHAEFLDDPELITETLERIDSGHSAAWSWQQTINQRVEAVRKLDDPILAGRAVDLSDVGNRVLRLLAGVIEEAPFVPDKPVILVAEDLSPSDTANLDPALILGFCTAAGGPTSHAAIIARSLDIPAIVGAGPVVLHQKEGQLAVLDGHSGNLYLELSETDLESARKAQQTLEELRQVEYRSRYQPAITTDGHRIEVAANINRVADAEQAVNAGGEGVGLLRTEFLFLERTEPPTEEEQYQTYAEMVQALNGLPIIIRTLDIGGDKNLPYLNLPAEDNSFLGIRGIRLCLAREDLFRPQLRAIYRASKLGPVRIMFPMISTVEDLMAAKKISEEVRLEVDAAPVKTGIMIEVPSAVVMAEELAAEVDFFSIGTNDLTQYTLAMDRLHPMLAKQADGLHPAVLRMIDQTVRAAAKAGIWVGVCGGIAGDPKGAVILMGLGVSELSVSIPSIAAIKAKIRDLSLADAQSMAQQALSRRTAADVRALTIP
jgi:phosphocarrier protein FPr